LWESDFMFRVSVFALPVVYLYLGWRFFTLGGKK